MNITLILSDIMEQKNFFNIISKKQNLQKLCEISFNEDCPLGSRTTTLSLLTKFVQQFSDRIKSNFHDDSGSMDDGADDDIIIEDSNNDENDEAKKKSDQVVYEVLESFVMPITDLLQKSTEPSTRISSYGDKEFKNLGVLKLRTIELLAALISLKNAQIKQKLVESNVCSTLLDYVIEYPWNNFIQLKIHQIFEDYLESDNTAQDQLDFFKKSDVVTKLLQMSDEAEVSFQTGNKIRNGYMGFVINLATKIKKVTQAEKISELDGAPKVLTDSWDAFLNGEFERSTALNEKALGGRSAQMPEEDEEASFDVNMDKIMQRFRTFNQVSVSSNSETDDSNKEDNDDEKEAIENEGGEGSKKIEIILPLVEPIDSSYSDAGFWKVDGIN